MINDAAYLAELSLAAAASSDSETSDDDERQSTATGTPGTSVTTGGDLAAPPPSLATGTADVEHRLTSAALATALETAAISPRPGRSGSVRIATNAVAATESDANDDATQASSVPAIEPLELPPGRLASRSSDTPLFTMRSYRPGEVRWSSAGYAPSWSVMADPS